MSPQTLSRSMLVWAVEEAAKELRQENHRQAVLDFARKAERVAVGAWSLETDDGVCFCPSSGAGIDRLTEEAQAFAGRFDGLLDVDPDEAEVFVVVSEGDLS